MMGQGDKKIRIRRTNEQLDKEVISEFEKLVGEFGFGNVNLSALMKAADLEANVFYRRYGSMDNLYDRLAKQYDFWINNTIDISTLNTLGPKKFFAETFKTLFRNLSENSVMQKLLLYEMTTINSTTKRSAETRDVMNLNLITFYENLFAPAKINIKSIASILIGGIYYLILHKECAKICTIDYKTKEGENAFSEGIDFLTDIIFDRLEMYYELDTGTLIAGATYKGEIEERLKGIIKELSAHGNAILFIDEIHTLIDPKSGNSGAASILKPELAKGNITVIGVTTVDEYRKLIEPDHALNRRFEVLQVSEPDLASTVNMIQAALERYESYHGVGVDVDSLPECVALAKRYVKERRLPDAAIDLIDRTLSAVKMINQSGEKDIKGLAEQLAAIEAAEDQPEAERTEKLRLVNFTMKNRLSPILLGMLSDGQNEPESSDYGEWMDYILGVLDRLRELTKEKIGKITSHEVAAVISSSTGIPIGKIESGEKEKLLNMEDILRRRVVGQDNALKVLTDAIVESRSGMNKPGQPIGSFFLLGPTGTGKTELAKALAEALFNDEKAMIRFDMSEFKEEHSAALLLGAPPGYVGYEEGGVLVNRIRRQPYAVVLFDEIEKAHSSVYDIFLQIMDEGKLHDRLGKEGDFSNSIVLFTSNVGSEWLSKQINEGKNPSTTDLMEVMGSYFRPEFLARLSEIVPFSPINETMLVRIFEIQLKGVIALLEKQHIDIEITEKAKNLLATRGFTPKYGARQVAGTIRNYIRRPISKMIVAGTLAAGNTVVVDVADNGDIDWNVK